MTTATKTTKAETSEAFSIVKQAHHDYLQRPLSAFRLWYRRNLQKYALDSRMNKLGVNALNGLMSEQWRTLDPREKQAYLEEAKINKEEFDRVRKKQQLKARHSPTDVSPLLSKSDTETRETELAVEGFIEKEMNEPSRFLGLSERLLQQKRHRENRIRDLQTELIKEQQMLLQLNNKLIFEVARPLLRSGCGWECRFIVVREHGENRSSWQIEHFHTIPFGLWLKVN